MRGIRTTAQGLAFAEPPLVTTIKLAVELLKLAVIKTLLVKGAIAGGTVMAGIEEEWIDDLLMQEFVDYEIAVKSLELEASMELGTSRAKEFGNGLFVEHDEYWMRHGKLSC